MRKRQRKKNQKRMLQAISLMLETWGDELRETQARQSLLCNGRGHTYKLVDWGDFCGYICLCCGEEIPIKKVELMSEIGKNAAIAGKTLVRQLTNKQRANTEE